MPRSHFRGWCGLGLLCAVAAASASAENWTVSWEGNDFPENEGWERDLWGPAPIRFLLGGVMTEDTRQTIELWDQYKLYHSIDCGPGETFFVSWRVLVHEVIGAVGVDPGVWLKTDNHRRMDFLLGVDHVQTHNFITIAEFEPGMFHTFEFRSSDMETFTFSVDGVQTYQGSLSPSAYASTLGWGDVIYGAASLANWKYVRFGVVPESSPAAFVLALAVTARRARRRRAGLEAHAGRRNNT
jgi:hypothetical protein